MKTALKIVAGIIALVVVVVVGFYLWASFTSKRLLARTFETHSVDFAVPFPLSAEELSTAESAHAEGSEFVAAQIARDRALERGRHLVEARYACIACHGADFSGGEMVDDPVMGTILCPNITPGEGGRVADYGPVDWDRIIRHGVLPDGRPAFMPSEEFKGMSDQELSDIIVYVTSLPAVDGVVPAPTLGPLGKVLVATGELPLSADMLEDHHHVHAVLPPPAEVSLAFGRHLSGVCAGCHGHDFAGGPIVGGDPSWPPARNLTPDASALGTWSYDDFVTAMREGTRPDGAELLMPMTLILPLAGNMTDVELEALWMFLQSLPPVSPAA